jgi:hypothetical protein
MGRGRNLRGKYGGEEEWVSGGMMRDAEPRALLPHGGNSNVGGLMLRPRNCR